jgi:hypothetical protein
MRLLRLLLIVVVCSGTLVTVGAGPALACSCAYGQTRDFVRGADEIVAGTLVGMDGPAQRRILSSTDPIRYTVAVDHVYRGEAGSVVEFESPASGASCGLEGMVVDRRYVVFLNADGATRTANLCGGTAPATPHLEAAVQRLTGSATGAFVGASAPPAGADEPSSAPGLSSHATVSGWTIAGGAGLAIALAAGTALWVRRRAA